MAEMLPLPEHYDPAHAADWSYHPDQHALLARAADWRRQHHIRPAAADTRRVELLLIDVQKDFCFPEGTLYVGGRSGRGAIEDSARMAAFLYRNAHLITGVTTTMDTHHAFQIFFPSFWVDADGQPLAPHRVVTTEDVDSGRARPNPDMAAWLCSGDRGWLAAEVRHYCAALERAGKYQLYLWPPHCVLGSDGHALAGVIHEARLFHAFLRASQPRVEIKGEHALTENYSVFSPEVLAGHQGNVLGQRSHALMRWLLAADAVIIAGQAASHCVKSSVDDLLDEIRAMHADGGAQGGAQGDARRAAQLAGKIYVLVDCMSAVAVPDGQGGFAADFTDQASRAQQRWAEAGMHLVRSTDPVSSWPGWPGR